MGSLPNEHRPASTSPVTITRRGRRVVVESADEYDVIEEVRPGLVALHFEGWTTSAHLESFGELFRSTVTRAGSIVLITNGDGCTGCETEVRESWTMWQKELRESIVAQHYFAPAAMMRMGLQMMSMESGVPVTLYRDLAEFESAVLAAYPQVDVASIRARPR